MIEIGRKENNKWKNLKENHSVEYFYDGNEEKGSLDR